MYTHAHGIRLALRGLAGGLHDIVVTHRRQGVSRMLLGATVAALKVCGVPRLVLQTAEQNALGAGACPLIRVPAEP